MLNTRRVIFALSILGTLAATIGIGCSTFPAVEEVPLQEPAVDVSHLTVAVSVELDTPDDGELSAGQGFHEAPTAEIPQHSEGHADYDFPTHQASPEDLARRWTTAIEARLSDAGVRVVGERGPAPMVELQVYVEPAMGPTQIFSVEDANQLRWEVSMIYDDATVDSAVWTAPQHVSSEGFSSRRDATRAHEVSLATLVVNAMFESPRVTEIAQMKAPDQDIATASVDPATAPSEADSEPNPAAEGEYVVAAPQPNAYALVIGVEDYRDLPPTPGARDDAIAFSKMLEQSVGVPDQNIHLLTDNGATRGDIIAQLLWFRENVSSDGRIYFFFSGHGSPNVESGESYLLPYEGRPETIEQTGLLMEDVMNHLEDTPARDIVAFVDACFSGSGDRSALPEGTRPLVPVQQAPTAPRVALFSSSAADEISGNAPDADEGLFTRHLVRAIGEGRADINGDGQISLQELATYVTPRVARQARQLNRNQTPSLSVPEGLGDPEQIILVWGLPRD